MLSEELETKDRVYTPHHSGCSRHCLAHPVHQKPFNRQASAQQGLATTCSCNGLHESVRPLPDPLVAPTIRNTCLRGYLHMLGAAQQLRSSQGNFFLSHRCFLALHAQLDYLDPCIRSTGLLIV